MAADSPARRHRARNPTTRPLQRLNGDYITSVQDSDVRRFDEILAEDFLCSHPDGSLVDRATSSRRRRGRSRSGISRPRTWWSGLSATSRSSTPDELHDARRRARARPLHRRLGAPEGALALRLGACDALLSQPCRRRWARWSGHVLAAVDLDDLAGDVAAQLFGGEIEERADAFLGVSEAVHRDRRLHGGELLGGRDSARGTAS